MEITLPMSDNASFQESSQKLSADEIIALDRAHVWHPYASFPNASPVYPVSHAEGVHLHLADGHSLVDGTASWWSVLHGYNHPVLNNAVEQQLHQVAHVMLGGLTHEPVVRLAKQLTDVAPAGLNKVFFSDSGSVAIEIAIKMAMQYWFAQGQHQRTRFLALRSGYHGDTFAAMSVCDPLGGMHHMFNQMLNHQIFTEAPSCKFDEEWDEKCLYNFSHLIQQHRQKIAAVILEPIAQNAGGMRFYSPHYLRRVRELCSQYDVLLIADEIATGFGRTGKLFACEHADISPDIMCVGKALTGGYLSLAGTLCNDKVSDAVSLNGGAFMHGPTFMGNPLACAVGAASLELLITSDWQTQVSAIAEQLKRELEACRELPAVADVRVLGGIGVVELKELPNMPDIQQQFVDQGVWIRPFGKLVYLMPSYIIKPEELTQLTDSMFNVISTIPADSN